MKVRLFACALAFTLGPALALAASPFTSNHPEEAIPDPDTRVHSGPHTELYRQVQERLRALGFNPGPVNGDFGEKTQAALAQFQISELIPASGQLDEVTLAHLGVRDYPITVNPPAAPSESLAAGAQEPPDAPKAD